MSSDQLRASEENGGIDFTGALRVLWSRKWLLFSVALLTTIASVVVSFVVKPQFEATVLLAPAEERSATNLGGQFGALASFAGIGIDQSGNATPLAVLTSRKFLRDFVEDLELMQVLFPNTSHLDARERMAESERGYPDIRDAVELFQERIVRVREDASTKLVTLTVYWEDGEQAALWAAALVDRLNEQMRARALQDAERNVAYLSEELRKSNVLTIQQSIARLLETEMQKLMLARGNSQFSFEILDPPVEPKYPAFPNRPLFALAGLLLGGMIGGFIILAIGFPQNELSR